MSAVHTGSEHHIREDERFAALRSECEWLAQQNANLTALHVASHRLHATLEPGVVLTGIQEIVINLIGTEEFAILERAENGGDLRVSASLGVDENALASIVRDRTVRRALATAQIVITDDGAPLACIPLRLGDGVAGVIVVFALLPQKRGLEEVDRDLFELLASQAGAALHCARLHVLNGATSSPVVQG